MAVKGARQEDTRDILDCLASHRQWRREEEGRRDSLEEENIDIDGLHRLKVTHNNLVRQGQSARL